MKQTTVGGTKRKVMNALAMAGLVIIFIAYMFPFIMVVINSLKQKRDSWNRAKSSILCMGTVPT